VNRKIASHIEKEDRKMADKAEVIGVSVRHLPDLVWKARKGEMARE
jgi:hypothetical protein